jgi:hypothetical protein
MPQTACATIATAAIFRPFRVPVPMGPEIDAAVIAKTPNTSAEGSVKAVKAASAPSQPARSIPMAKPTCEEAGPGRNWHSATRSA